MHRSRIPLSHDTLLLDALGKSKRHQYWNSARALSLKLKSLIVIYSSRGKVGVEEVVMDMMQCFGETS